MRPTTIARRFDRLGPGACSAPSLVLAGCSSIGPGAWPRPVRITASPSPNRGSARTLLNIVKPSLPETRPSLWTWQIVPATRWKPNVSWAGPLQRMAATASQWERRDDILDRTDHHVPATDRQPVRGGPALMPPPPRSVLSHQSGGRPAALFGSFLAQWAQEPGDVLDWCDAGAPEFLRVLAFLRKIQMTGTIALRIGAGTS